MIALALLVIAGIIFEVRRQQKWVKSFQKQPVNKSKE